MRLEDCIAKTVSSPEGETTAGVDVETHCLLVGLVARELIARYPQSLQASLFPAGTELVAALHDVGKINPHFQKKIRRDIKDDPQDFPDLRDGDPSKERTIGWHQGVGQIALTGVASQFVPEIVGCHHGESPESRPVTMEPDAQVIGGESWQALRMQLVAHARQYLRQDWPKIESEVGAALLAGLTTVADWIGSGYDFPANIMKESPEVIGDHIRKAVDGAGFIAPQVAEGLRFQDIFPGFLPRKMQEQLVAMADCPGVYILEAQMGQGKTEAALQVAYHLLERRQATGLYFALPTKLTSEKIYERVSRFLKNILTESDRHKTLLLHGDAWMTETTLGEEGNPGHSWFDSGKRRILAPFAVGTIDQALMGVMNVRHGFVRTFGLAGKVVVLDEVHTYDAYTGTLMDTLIHNLEKLGCTVIILSATLTAKRKQAVLNANARKSTRKRSSEGDYPLLSGRNASSGLRFVAPGGEAPRAVAVEMSHDERQVWSAVREKLLDGQYILWLENTVFEAQHSYKKIAAWAHDQGIPAGLLHGRFTPRDRRAKEDTWVSAFGKNNRKPNDVRGRMLVGTQVLEQSLDIDADFLVSRMAPSDMLLQRIGRLHRHTENDELRPRSAERKIVILAPPPAEIEQDPKRAFGKSGKVYSPYVLTRSFEVWRHRQAVTLPDSMRPIIEETYRERAEEGAMAQLLHELKEGQEKLQRFARINMSRIGKAMNDDTARSRYSDVETAPVLLLGREPRHTAGKVVGYDGGVIALPSAPSAQERKRRAIELSQRIVNVPEYLAPQAIPIKNLRWLSPYLYIGNRLGGDNSGSFLRVGIVGPSGAIGGLNTAEANEKYTLAYNNNIGYSFS